MSKMKNSPSGWIKINRRLFDHWIWTSEKPFDDRSAWVDLIGMMNHKDKIVQLRMTTITVHRGQHHTSIGHLSERWHWSKAKVYRYLDMLEKEGMLHRDATQSGTLLTLVNYDKYAFGRNATESSIESTTESIIESSIESSTESRTIMNNNDIRMIKNEKERSAGAPPSGGEWQ